MRGLILSLAVVATASAAAAAEQAAFVSSREAMRWLAHELPQLTFANPKYRSRNDGTVSQWVTKSVRFRRDNKGFVQVAMVESYTQTKGRVATPGRHKATFSLADVEISDLTQPDDVTPAGDAARGVLFTCKAAGCIAAVWGGNASRGDKTDISIQDDASRAMVLSAFHRLATHSD